MPAQTDEPRTRQEEAVAVLQRCNTESPNPADIESLREHLKAVPWLWKCAGDLSELAGRSVVETVSAYPATKESVLAGREAIRRDLGYESSPLLERMLVDHLVLCWMRLQLTEYRYSEFLKAGGSFQEAEYWEKRLSANQRRYLRAVETLARIRRLALPAIQVNIGGQQVNVAGG
ncbi:hypothetical protein LLH23_01645 [bacterium]|nr:hypothetical protein [bacterium]